MKKLIIAIGLASSGVLLATHAWSHPHESPLVVSVSPERDGCQFVISGERITSDRLVILARSARKRRGIVIYDKDTPYRCIGSAIYALQSAGLAQIDAVLWDRYGNR